MRLHTLVTQKLILSAIFLLSALPGAFSQEITKDFSLESSKGLSALNVELKPATYLGKKCISVIDTAKNPATEVRLVKLSELSFHNGTIELELAGQPLKTADESARGFVGLAFRINGDNTAYECFYLRPTNGRAEDQLRRNHSLQYISYPDYPWEKLRKETPGKYESYADLEAGKWTKIKIVVRGEVARLYVNEASQPSLIVLDLKHGTESKGALGLWVGNGTEAHFRNLRVKSED